jgi:enoyl-CoA hydratase
MSRALLRGLDVYKPIIAAINGLALGGGTELALATDLRVAAAHASFGLPEPRSGIVPGGGSMVRLPRQVGWCHAMQILLLGDPIAAPDALRMGLINEVVAKGALLARAEELATRIGRCAPVALAKIKEAALRSSGEPLARAFEIESECAAAVIRTRDAREGPRAFMEKRAPVWTGQ